MRSCRSSPRLLTVIDESWRRILIAGVHRATCGTLPGTALFLDPGGAGGANRMRLTATGLYFASDCCLSCGCSAIVDHPATRALLTLLVGDIAPIAMLMYSGGSASGPLPILLFPQLAASGWMMRSRVALFHAALASSVLIAVDSWRLIDGLIQAPQILQTGLIGFGYFATVGVALLLGRYTKASEELAGSSGVDVTTPSRSTA